MNVVFRLGMQRYAFFTPDTDIWGFSIGWNQSGTENDAELI